MGSVTVLLKLIKTYKGHYQKYYKDDQYIDLKAKCKYHKDIDEVIEDATINFILNMPSDLYRLLNP